MLTTWGYDIIDSVKDFIKSYDARRKSPDFDSVEMILKLKENNLL